MAGIISGSGVEPKFVAWGTGVGDSGVSDTALFSEASESRVIGATSRATTNVADDTCRVIGVVTASSAKTITEVGLFDAESGGNLLAKSNFPGIDLYAGESIRFVIDLVF